MHPRGLNFWLIPYNPPTNPLHNLGVVENLLTKAPLLGQESDALIPTIAREGGGGGGGGNCIDRCIKVACK